MLKVPEVFESEPGRTYRIVNIEDFNPAAFDNTVEEVGRVTERDLDNGHWRDLDAKYIIIGDSLVLFHPDGVHRSFYEDIRANDSSLVGELYDAGMVNVNQTRSDDGMYKTRSRRFSETSRTLRNSHLIDEDAAFEYRTKTLPQKLANDFYWN
jgi:hypothetical protein